MENDELKNYINTCLQKLNANIPELYEIYFFKIYVKFEVFLSQLFEDYCIGVMSGKGYCPNRKLEFIDKEHLRAVLKGDKQYMDYIKKIESLSRHIFIDNPFDLIFQVAENNNLFDQMITLRNYIAHESPESRKRYIETCLGGGQFIEPYQYLAKINRRKSKSNYTIYMEKIVEISDMLLEAPVL